MNLSFHCKNGPIPHEKNLNNFLEFFSNFFGVAQGSLLLLRQHDFFPKG
jgi:hypothetical protein